jgi:large subunit ribosomal protein L18
VKRALERYEFRKIRTRRKISGNAQVPRLSVYRGHKNIYAQLVDDANGHTLVSVSTLSEELKSKLKVGDNIAAAKAVGELVAKKGLEKGIKKIVFDRGGHIFAGRIKALADTARKAGLEF